MRVASSFLNITKPEGIYNSRIWLISVSSPKITDFLLYKCGLNTSTSLVHVLNACACAYTHTPEPSHAVATTFALVAVQLGD